MVARLTPSSRAMEETVLSGRVSRSRVLGDLVEEGVDGDLDTNRERGLVDPFAGQRRDRPRAG
jgi:hypothetical protein